MPLIRSQYPLGCHPEAKPKDLQLFFVTALCATSVYDREMHEGSYFVYIMASRSRTLYVGVAGDLLRRVFQHKWKEHEGFSTRYNCDRLIWFEGHQDVRKAIDWEKELKGWRRTRKIALIESVNPTWTDLSRDWYDCEPADYLRARDRMNS
jgi:putative endonuclease